MAAANSVAEFIKNIHHLCLLIINKSQPIFIQGALASVPRVSSK